MGLKWKYSQVCASICLDHSGGCPSIGQTFLCSDFFSQPPAPIRLRSRARSRNKCFGLVTARILSGGDKRCNQLGHPPVAKAAGQMDGLATTQELARRVALNSFPYNMENEPFKNPSS